MGPYQILVYISIATSSHLYCATIAHTTPLPAHTIGGMLGVGWLVLGVGEGAWPLDTYYHVTCSFPCTHTLSQLTNQTTRKKHGYWITNNEYHCNVEPGMLLLFAVSSSKIRLNTH